MAAKDKHREPELPLPHNLHELQHPKEESPDRPETDRLHGELARMPEDEVEIDEPHVGDMRGPVADEPDNPEVREQRKAMDPDIGFKWPPIRPREVQ